MWLFLQVVDDYAKLSQSKSVRRQKQWKCYPGNRKGLFFASSSNLPGSLPPPLLQSVFPSVSLLSSMLTHYSNGIPKPFPCPTVGPTIKYNTEDLNLFSSWDAGWQQIPAWAEGVFPASWNLLISTKASEPERRRHSLLLSHLWSSFPLIRSSAAPRSSALRLWRPPASLPASSSLAWLGDLRALIKGSCRTNQAPESYALVNKLVLLDFSRFQLSYTESIYLKRLYSRAWLRE